MRIFVGGSLRDVPRDADLCRDRTGGRHDLRERAPSVAEDYETLNSLSINMSEHAEEVIPLVERLVTPRNVFTIMSFKREFRDVFASCREVCREFKFEAERTDESASVEPGNRAAV